MPDNRLPKHLLVSAPLGGKCAESKDLRQYNLSRTWKEEDQMHDSWRATIKQSNLLFSMNKQRSMRRVTKTKRSDVVSSGSLIQKNGLHCDYPGCSILAITKAGLTNHQRQQHATNPKIRCQFRHQIFNKQGLYNHQRFCSARPSSPT